VVSGSLQLRSCSTSPFGDLIGGFGHDIHDLGALKGDHHLERAGIEEIPYQNRRLITPQGIGGFSAPAHVRGVHHIVVEQRGGVDELNDRCHGDRLSPLTAGGTGGQQHQQGPQALAATIDNIVAELIDQHDVRVELALDFPVYRGKIVLDQFTNRLQGHGFGRFHSRERRGNPSSPGRGRQMPQIQSRSVLGLIGG